VKAVVFAVEGSLKGVGMAEYPILTPRLGYAEQYPESLPVWTSAQPLALGAAVTSSIEIHSLLDLSRAPQDNSGGHHRNRFTNRLLPVRNG
jgi:hypothetical protein